MVPNQLSSELNQSLIRAHQILMRTTSPRELLTAKWLTPDRHSSECATSGHSVIAVTCIRERRGTRAWARRRAKGACGKPLYSLPRGLRPRTVQTWPSLRTGAREVAGLSQGRTQRLAACSPWSATNTRDGNRQACVELCLTHALTHALMKHQAMVHKSECRMAPQPDQVIAGTRQSCGWRRLAESNPVALYS